MNDGILLYLLAIALYAGLCARAVRLFVGAGAGRAGRRAARSKTLTGFDRGALLLAVLVHGLAVHWSMLGADGVYFGIGLAASLMFWMAAVFYWIESFYARLDGLYLPIVLAALAGCLAALVFPLNHLLANMASPLFRVHFVVAMLAYSLFALVALHALLMMMAERQLRRGRMHWLLLQMPPLLTLEALLFRLIGIAFVLLTATVFSGAFFSEQLFGQPFRLNHKTFFGFLSWFLFGALLIGRKLQGWRGRIALRWTLAGVFSLLLAYLGSRFVLEILLQRGA